MEASLLRPRVAEWAKNPYMIAYIVVSSVMIALLLIHVVLSCTICRAWRQKRKDANIDPEQQGPIDPRPYERAVPAPGCLDPDSFAESPTNSRSGGTFEEIDLSDGVKTAHAVPVMHVQKEPQADDTPPRSILREDRPQGPPFFTLRTVQLSPRSKGVTFAPTPQVFAPA